MNNIFKKPARTPKDILTKAAALAKEFEKPNIVVAVSHDEDVLEAVYNAQKQSIAKVILVGDENKTKRIAKKFNINVHEFDILNFPNEEDALYHSLILAKEKKADIIMKGFVSTSKLMKAVLSQEFELRTGNTLSHIAVVNPPNYHKLLAISDGGVIIRPNEEQKKQMIENAKIVMKALGIENPKIAILNNITSTNIKEEFVENISFEYALSKELAKENFIKSRIAGDVDIIIASCIETVNIVVKALVYWADTNFAGVILGAKVPISLCSRTDTMENKMLSLSLACVVSHYIKHKL
jgi:phosphate butyryltransferase